MMQMINDPASTTQSNDLTVDINWGFQIGIRLAPPDMDAFYAAGNITRVGIGEGAFRENPIDLSAMMTSPQNATYSQPISDGDAALAYVPTDQVINGSGNPESQSSTAIMDSALTAVFPDTVNGTFVDLYSAIVSASIIGGTEIPVSKSIPGSALQVTTSACSIDWSPDGGGGYRCLGTDTEGVVNYSYTPAYVAIFDDGFVGNLLGLVCQMDGAGTVIQTTYDGTGAPLEQAVSLGSDSEALSQVGALYTATTGQPFPDGMVGYAAVSLTRNLDHLEVSGITASSVFDFQSLVVAHDYAMATAPTANVMAQSAYLIPGDSPPPISAPPVSFQFPTQDSNMYRWSIPPFKARLPFQNYTFGLPNFRLKGN